MMMIKYCNSKMVLYLLCVGIKGGNIDDGGTKKPILDKNHEHFVKKKKELKASSAQHKEEVVWWNIITGMVQEKEREPHPTHWIIDKCK
jgi:hypothetical protein